jgi:hypothetical protein
VTNFTRSQIISDFRKNLEYQAPAIDGSRKVSVHFLIQKTLEHLDTVSSMRKCIVLLELRFVADAWLGDPINRPASPAVPSHPLSLLLFFSFENMSSRTL